MLVLSRASWMTPGSKPHIAIGSSASLVDL